MHKSSYAGMGKMIAEHFPKIAGRPAVIDVGAMDINGCYRQLFGPAWRYVGVDLAAGPNVDKVMAKEFEIPLPDACAELVISGQVLEHCRNPFRLVREMARLLKPNGWAFLVAPREWPEHHHPWDCWRFLPDGMRAVLEDAGLKVETSKVVGVDCWGVARRPA